MQLPARDTEHGFCSSYSRSADTGCWLAYSPITGMILISSFPFTTTMKTARASCAGNRYRSNHIFYSMVLCFNTKTFTSRQACSLLFQISRQTYDQQTKFTPADNTYANHRYFVKARSSPIQTLIPMPQALLLMATWMQHMPCY